jgi:hypothetical protein
MPTSYRSPAPPRTFGRGMTVEFTRREAQPSGRVERLVMHPVKVRLSVGQDYPLRIG